VGVANGFVWFLLSIAVMTVGEMINMPLCNTVTADLAPTELRGRYMGLLGIAWNVGFGLGPWLGGKIADTWGYGTLWPTMGLLGFLAAGAYLFLGRSASERFNPALANVPQEALHTG
jgi:MFS family permease